MRRNDIVQASMMPRSICVNDANMAIALRKQLSAHSIYYLWYSCSSAVQSVSLSAGLTAACFLAVWEVMQGTQPLGNFVILLSYWSAASSKCFALPLRHCRRGLTCGRLL